MHDRKSLRTGTARLDLNTPIIKLTPRIIKRILRDISKVELLATQTVTRFTPPLGTLGGAGKPVLMTELTFSLGGDVSDADLKSLYQIASKEEGVITWNISREDLGTNMVAMARTDWRIQAPQYLLVLTCLGKIAIPSFLSASIRDEQNKPFIWRIQKIS